MASTWRAHLPVNHLAIPVLVMPERSCSGTTTRGPRWNRAEEDGVWVLTWWKRPQTWASPPQNWLKLGGRVNHPQYTLQNLYEQAAPAGPLRNRSRKSTILKQCFQEELLDYLVANLFLFYLIKWCTPAFLHSACFCKATVLNKNVYTIPDGRKLREICNAFNLFQTQNYDQC